MIPKADRRPRQFGIAAAEDKIAQRAVGTLLNSIWEEDFKGFRMDSGPGAASTMPWMRCGCAVCGNYAEESELGDRLGHPVIFDKIDHEWRQANEQWMVLYIERWLKAPVPEEDRQLVAREKGTPQGVSSALC